MRRFSHAFAVDGVPIDRVWAFYTDIGHLEVITPPEMGLKVVKCTTGRQLAEGTEVWLEGNLVLKSRWHSRITRMKPYVYVDEMLEGRFRVWKHTHSFEPVGDKITTKVIDEIDFELHYGPLGKMLEGYVEKRLAKIFAHRKDATIKALR
ncbi:SRPBCC family protein [Candidatus Nitrososphaera evergladensis]|uniref:SRPBCC family protein n=1 Tax=Candidatus Nitrososphaera evergladensis TaxID=1459637 RepID=UPI00130E02F9|nr:SRPBCC family protein [Candidatus Nitrososphaera evergladensis]